MPYVRVILKEKGVNQEFVRRLNVDLPEIVARVMSVPDDAKLHPGEITVDGSIFGHNHQPVGLIAPPQVAEKDYQIIVISNWFAAREAIKDKLAAQILEEVDAFAPEGTTGWVWVLLQNGGFATT